MSIFTANGRLPEINFRLESDFEEDVYQNSKLLFGENTILLNTKTLLRGNILGGTIPDGFLFDLSNINDPQFYLIEVELAKHSFNGHIFPQITKFFAFFKNQQQRQSLTEKLYEVITGDPNILAQFRKHIGDREIFKFVKDVLESSQNILIVIDGEKTEINDISEVYTDTWGKMVKHIVLRKYSDGKNTVYHLEPDFEILEITGDEKVVSEKSSYGETHHTDDIPENIVSIYFNIKARALEINPNLIFNPTKSYISIKNGKNVAFISIKKKRIRLIPLRPETEIREIVIAYEVGSLPDSVQKFWNGECAEILIENDNGIEEIMEVLKPLILQQD